MTFHSVWYADCGSLVVLRHDVNGVAFFGIELHTPTVSPSYEGVYVFLYPEAVVFVVDGVVKEGIISKKADVTVETLGDVVE